MPKITRSALVMFSAQSMYDLVSDVESYPDFLPWCEEVKILEMKSETLDVALVIAKGSVRQVFSTRNRMSHGSIIEIDLIDGPFSKLQGVWNFKALGANGCKVSIEMDFDVSNKLIKTTIGPVFGRVINTLIDAFAERAEKIYG